MDKAILFTPEVAAYMMFNASINAVVCISAYAIVVILIGESHIGKRICKSVSSLFSKFKKRGLIHG